MKHKKEKDKVNDDRIIIIIILTFLCKLTWSRSRWNMWPWITWVYFWQ